MSDPKVGTGKKPKGSGRRLYTDENPRDTVRIKFATPTDASATVNTANYAQFTTYSDASSISSGSYNSGSDIFTPSDNTFTWFFTMLIQIHQLQQMEISLWHMI